MAPKRYRAFCSYEGTDFQGFQSQSSGLTVQDHLESVFEEVFKQPVRVHASSRTDSGVHALGQLLHFEVEWNHPLDALERALNTLLPDTIRVFEVKRVGSHFHARFSPKWKIYTYKFYCGHASPLETRYTWSIGSHAFDVEKVHEALALFEGTHDFSAFTSPAVLNKEENPVKTLRKLSLAGRAPCYEVTIEGSGFLYKMVRNLVGTAVSVGQGKLSLERLEQLLKDKVRTKEVICAPAHGLCLKRVLLR